MPFYDVTCEQGHVECDVLAKVEEYPPCAQCGAPTSRLWTTRAGRGADVTWPGGKTFENLADQPQTFYSKSDYTKYLKANNIEEFVRHVPVPGSDKSPHTVSWAAVSQSTLDGAKAMLERVGAAHGRDPEPQTWIESMTVTVTDEAGTVWAPRGTFGASHVA